MSVSALLGNPKPQFFVAGIPAVGYRLFFYDAGTSTKLNTFTDSTALTTNSNPIVLDAEGYPTSNVMIYGTDNVGYKVIMAPPGSDDPPTSPTWTIDRIYTTASGLVQTGTTVVNFNATVGQTLFTLPTGVSYGLGNNSLEVYLGNGLAGGRLRLTKDQDYTETSVLSFTLSYAAIDGDKITAVIGKSLASLSTLAASSVILTSDQNLQNFIGNTVINVADAPYNVSSSNTAAQNDTGFALALAAVKQGTATKKNSGRLFIPFDTEGYKISQPLTISDHRGLTIEFESTQTYSTDADTGSNCQLQWYGASTDSVIKLITLSYGIKIINPSINCVAGGISALAGIQIGSYTGTTAARDITIENPFIIGGRIGIGVAFGDNGSVDAAPVRIFNGIISSNADAGLLVGGGNCLVTTYGMYYTGNGNTPTVDSYNPAGIGANCFVSSGQLHEYDRTATGTAITNADVYQQNGTYSWWGGWSEVHGVMINNVANSIQKPLTIQNIRHYDSTMTDVDTPTSLIIRSPGTTIISCLLFGDLQVTSGISGSPISIGTQFYNGADLGTRRPTLGIGKFKGTGVTTQHSLIHLGNKGNNAQILMGGADSGVSLTDLGTYEPQILSFGTAKTGTGLTESIMQWRGAGSSDSTGTMYIANAAYGSLGFVINGYWSSATQITPINTSAAVFVISLGNVGNGFDLRVYDPNGSAAAFNYSSMVFLGGWKVATTNGYRSEGVFIPPQRAANPTYSSAGFWTGGIYYNTTTNKLRLGVAGTAWEEVTSV